MAVLKSVVRLIPACAGNIQELHLGVGQWPAHPRVCGEHSLKIEWRPAGHGSSPRVRGTYDDDDYSGGQRRLIPACAGNMGGIARRPIPAPAHPRVCGEHPIAGGNHDPIHGSSPRVRGTFLRTMTTNPIPRLIPACAGNIVRAFLRARLATAHPRVCGEHGRNIGTSTERAGSSPRVRGTCVTGP